MHQPESGSDPWIETYTGRQFFFLRPTPEMIDLQDICVPLSRDCRYGGHTTTFYSVAEHSALLANWVMSTTGDRRVALQALLHDASEAYLRDIPRPIKAHLTGYGPMEDRIMAAVMAKYDLPARLHPIVKEADGRILVDERRQVMSDSGHAWETDCLEPLGVRVQGLDPISSHKFFLDTMRALGGA